MSATLAGCGCECTPNADPCQPCGGAVAIQSFCRSRSGTYTLCGVEEYTSPSTPPKKYLEEMLSGSNTTKLYAGPGCDGDLQPLTCIVSVSGKNSYSPTPAGCGTQAIGAVATVQSTGAAVEVPCTSITNAFCAADCGSKEQTTTRTRITIKAVLLGGGSGCASQCEAAGDELQQELGSEDTEQAAIGRSPAVFNDWAPSTGCCSSLEVRTSGFTGSYSEGEMKYIVTGPKGGTFNIDVPFYRYLIGDVPTTTSFKDVYQVSIGDEGQAEFTVAVPSKRGFTTCAGQAYLSADQPVQ